MPEHESSLMPPSTLQPETVTHSHIQTERKADYPKSHLINTQSLKHHGRNANFVQLSHGKSNSVLEAKTQGHFYQTPAEDLSPAAVSLQGKRSSSRWGMVVLMKVVLRLQHRVCLHFRCKRWVTFPSRRTWLACWCWAYMIFLILNFNFIYVENKIKGKVNQLNCYKKKHSRRSGASESQRKDTCVYLVYTLYVHDFANWRFIDNLE